MPPPPELKDLPPGLSQERTELAWSRTVIAFAAVGGALLKTSVAAGLTVVALGVLVWGLLRVFPGPKAVGDSGRRLLVVAVGVTGVSLVALAVAFLGP
jgi:uncharacterized membrane protein YidH (DUF202 family)